MDFLYAIVSSVLIHVFTALCIVITVRTLLIGEIRMGTYNCFHKRPFLDEYIFGNDITSPLCLNVNKNWIVNCIFYLFLCFCWCTAD